MSLSMSSRSARPEGQVLRWRRALAARLAQPQRFWLDEAGLNALDGSASTPLADWAAQHGGSALSLIVSERLIHPLLCEPGLPLADASAVAAYAQQQFLHYFGSAAQRWPLAGWRQGQGEAAGAFALHVPDWPQRQELLAAQALRLASLRPASVAALQALAEQEPSWFLAEHAALAWVEGGLLCWVRLARGVPQAWQHLRLAEASSAALQERLTELQAPWPGLLLRVRGYGLADALPQQPRLQAAGPEAAHFERSAAATAAPQADFIAQPPPRSRLAWPLLACGLAVLGTAAFSAWQGHEELQLLRQRTQAQQQLQRQVKASAAPSTSKSPAPARKGAEADDWKAAIEAQGLLRYRWDALLTTVEQAGQDPATPLSWLALDAAANRRELRLEGVVADKLQALQLVDRLSAAPGWREVLVGRLQNGNEGLAGQRFELTARLQAEQLRLAQPAAAAASGVRP